MKKILCVLFLFLSFISCVFSQENQYEIYSKLVNDKEINWTDKKAILILNKTVKEIDSDVLFELSSYSDNLPDYLKNYFDVQVITKYTTDVNFRNALLGLLKVSEEKMQIEAFLPPSFYLKLISENKFKSYLKKGILTGWNKILDKYQSNWVVEFSNVSFSGNYAAVYYGKRCGGLCGSGDIYVFEKNKEDWKLISKINVWMN